MSELLLNSLEIKGYRCFEHLTVKKLGRVNLIVGKNNVGKTAFLETLRIYANHDDEWTLDDILFERNEMTTKRDVSHESLLAYNAARLNLFTNRPPVPGRNHKREDSAYFIISEINETNELLERLVIRPTEEEFRDDHNFRKKVYDTAGKKTTFVRFFYSGDSHNSELSFIPRVDRNIKNLFVNSAGLTNDKLIQFWDAITLTPLEDKVIEALHILMGAIFRIDFIGFPIGSQNRVPVVRLENQSQRLPLKSFGEGMTRLLGLAMALAQCQNGMLFIDEIESGLHYSIFPEVWRLIFNTAEELNIQIFATTHSKDCVESFAEAAANNPEDGMLIRLEQQDKSIVAKIFEEEILVDAVNYEVEVR